MLPNGSDCACIPLSPEGDILFALKCSINPSLNGSIQASAGWSESWKSTNIGVGQRTNEPSLKSMRLTRFPQSRSNTSLMVIPAIRRGVVPS